MPSLLVRTQAVLVYTFFFSSLCLSNFLAIAPSAIDMERRRRLTALTRVGWERELHLIWGGQVSSVITEETKKKKPDRDATGVSRKPYLDTFSHI